MPVLRTRGEDMQRAAIFGGRQIGALDIVAVGLVDGDHIGEFEHALLDALQRVTRAGERQQHERVDHAGDRRLGLADADGLDEHDVEPGGLEEGVLQRRLDLGARAEGRGHPDIAGVDVGLDVGEAGALAGGLDRVLGELALRSEVDRAEEREVGRHGLIVSGLSPASRGPLR